MGIYQRASNCPLVSQNGKLFLANNNTRVKRVSIRDQLQSILKLEELQALVNNPAEPIFVNVAIETDSLKYSTKNKRKNPYNNQKGMLSYSSTVETDHLLIHNNNGKKEYLRKLHVNNIKLESCEQQRQNSKFNSINGKRRKVKQLPAPTTEPISAIKLHSQDKSKEQREEREGNSDHHDHDESPQTLKQKIAVLMEKLQSQDEEKKSVLKTFEEKIQTEHEAQKKKTSEKFQNEIDELTMKLAAQLNHSEQEKKDLLQQLTQSARQMEEDRKQIEQQATQRIDSLQKQLEESENNLKNEQRLLKESCQRESQLEMEIETLQKKRHLDPTVSTLNKVTPTGKVSTGKNPTSTGKTAPGGGGSNSTNNKNNNEFEGGTAGKEPKIGKKVKTT